MNKNKTGKYLKYALGEILLVVIGILIALQINNWNEARKLSNKEQLYLHSLKLDLEQSQTALDRVIKKTERVSKSVDTFASLLRSHGENLSPFQMDTLSRNASGFTVFMPSEGVINDIIGSGKLDMISNIELRSKIASWEADLRMIREFEKLSREADDKYAVHSTQYFDDVNGKFRQAAFIENKRSIFLKDNILSNSMVGIYRLSKILNRHYLEKSKDIDSLINIIDSELK